jgi:hypothetical protein
MGRILSDIRSDIMKRFIVAAIVAIFAATSFAPVAEAGRGWKWRHGYKHHHGWRHHGWRGHHHGHYYGHRHGWRYRYWGPGVVVVGPGYYSDDDYYDEYGVRKERGR